MRELPQEHCEQLPFDFSSLSSCFIVPSAPFILSHRHGTWLRRGEQKLNLWASPGKKMRWTKFCDGWLRLSYPGRPLPPKNETIVWFEEVNVIIDVSPGVAVMMVEGEGRGGWELDWTLRVWCVNKLYWSSLQLWTGRSVWTQIVTDFSYFPHSSIGSYNDVCIFISPCVVIV